MNLSLMLNCRIMKHEVKFWLKANPNSHTTKHHENKLKNLLKRKKNFLEIIRAQHMCVLTKVNTLSF
jgi:hypothetical protein